MENYDETSNGVLHTYLTKRILQIS